MIEKLLRAIAALSPFLAAYPTWVKGLFTAWVLLSAVVLVSLILSRRPPVSETVPAPIPNSSTEAQRTSLRQDRKLRALRDIENDLPLARLPSGVYGFILPEALGHTNPTLSRKAGDKAVVEVHKLPDGEVHFLGFVSQSDALGVESGAASSVELFTSPWEEATTLTSIPSARIGAAQARSFRDGVYLIDIRLRSVAGPSSDNDQSGIPQSGKQEDERSRRFAELEPLSQPNVFEIMSCETTLVVRPVSPKQPVLVTYQHPNPETEEITTDNVAEWERTLRFSPENRCTSQFKIHYHTEAKKGLIKLTKLSHRNEASAEERGAYEAGRNIFIYKFTPKPDEVYEIGIEIYNGFATGHRDTHSHFGSDKHYHYFKYTLDLRPYLEAGYEVTRGPIFSQFHDERDNCVSCRDLSSADPVQPSEAADGRWSWELRDIRQGAMTLIWDVAPKAERLSGVA